MGMDPLEGSVRDYANTLCPAPPKRGISDSPTKPSSKISCGTPLPSLEPSPVPPPRFRLEESDFGPPPIHDDLFLDDFCLEDTG